MVCVHSCYLLLYNKPPPKCSGFKQQFIFIYHGFCGLRMLSQAVLPSGLSCGSIQMAAGAAVSESFDQSGCPKAHVCVWCPDPNGRNSWGMVSTYSHYAASLGSFTTWWPRSSGLLTLQQISSDRLFPESKTEATKFSMTQPQKSHSVTSTALSGLKGPAKIQCQRDYTRV